MTIADWGSIGEVAGSAGVLVTLIFLVAQMRQNTLAIKSVSLEGVLIGYAALNREWFGVEFQVAYSAPSPGTILISKARIVRPADHRHAILHGRV